MLLILSLLLPVLAIKAAPFTVENLIHLNRLHDVSVSPQGDTLLYGLSHGQTDGDDHLFVMNLAKGTVKQLTNSQFSEHNVIWAHDGKSIYFLSKRSGSRQVWQLLLDGGEAQQISDLPLDIDGFKLSDDAQTVALSITVKPGCHDFDCTLQALTKAQQQKATVRQYDQLMIRHWDQWHTAFKKHIFIAHKNTNGQIIAAQDVIPDWQTSIAGIDQVAIAPDGKSVVFSAKYPAKDQAWSTNFDLYEVQVDTLQLANITEANKAWDASPVFSSDGRFLAYKAMNTPGYESDKFSIKVRDNVTGKITDVAANWTLSVDELRFADDNRTLMVTAQDHGQKSIFAIYPEFGDVRNVYGIGTSSNIISANGKVYFIRHTLNTPPDIFVVNNDGYEVKQLTSVNKTNLADIHFADYQQFTFKGWNNEMVSGYWLKPANFDASKKYPIAFIVHGGPQGSFANQFNFRWNAQLWAAQGYGVVMIDFHGSTGYGQAFTDSIARDWGGKPLEDLQKGLAYIVKQQSWLDADNVCALGASYGGYMMNWIEGNWPDRFKCIVNHAGLFDLPSFYLSTEELWFPEHDLGGTPWSGSVDYQKFNPAGFIKQWHTPMLITQGEQDFRVPYTQSIGAFTALQRKGIDSRLVMFPDENHHILNTDNLVLWYHEVFAWLKRYTEPSLAPVTAKAH